jgi:hypothetical protein
MEYRIGTRYDEGEDDSALIDAFFLPGGILDPEDDVDVGYKDSLSSECTPSLSINSIASPVSLNPWNTLQATQVDAGADWVIDHTPRSQSCLPETLPSDGTTPRQQNQSSGGSFSANAPLADSVVHLRGFRRPTPDNVESTNSPSPLVEDRTTGNAVSSTEQTKTRRSISFADVIRSSPSATFDTPERLPQKRHPGQNSTTENGGSSCSTGKQVPRARSSSPLGNRTDQSKTIFQKLPAKKVSRQVDKPTQPLTEWNDVDRSSVGRIASQSNIVESTPVTQPRPSSKFPNLLFDSDDDTHEKNDESSSEPLLHIPHDCNGKMSHTSELNRTAAFDESEPDLSHAVFDSEHAVSLDAQQFKIDERDEKGPDTPTASLSEPSNVRKKNASSTKSESTNSEIITLLALLLDKLMVSIYYLAFFLWNLALLIAFGSRNVLIYATWEASFNDGALVCYLLLYTLPIICDWMMAHLSLPHFFPHVVSTVCLYFLSSFPSQPPRTNSSRVSNEASRLFLVAFRYYLPLALILEGFKEPNSMVMLLNQSSRLVLAYFLSMLQAGFLLSPVAWLGWSIQVILAFWLPEGFLSSCIISLSGLSLIWLMSVLPVRKTACT